MAKKDDRLLDVPLDLSESIKGEKNGSWNEVPLQ
jgi:hypothetical protein